EWRLPDATGDESHVVVANRLGKPVAKRAPEVDLFTDFHLGKQPRHFANDKINNVDAGRLTALVEYRVIKRKRPTQQWISAFRQPEHDELPGPNCLGDLRTFESNEKRVFRKLAVNADGCGALAETHDVIVWSSSLMLLVPQLIFASYAIRRRSGAAT